ncbi:MAG TPA: Hsp70 family protein [Pyrinomonadaceae bacterium]|nr:Hsp70 family protein [Pyrinomonadaceae bacterium]
MNVHCQSCGAVADLSRAPQTCEFCGAPIRPNQAALARALRIETAGGVASILLPQWTLLPASFVETYSTAEDNQTAVGVHLLEGDADTVGGCRSLGWFTLSGISPRPRGVPQIQFTLEVAADGAMEISVEELETNNRKTFRGPKLPVMK